jgi:hypothetical protein
MLVLVIRLMMITTIKKTYSILLSPSSEAGIRLPGQGFPRFLWNLTASKEIPAIY